MSGYVACVLGRIGGDNYYNFDSSRVFNVTLRCCRRSGVRINDPLGYGMIMGRRIRLSRRRGGTTHRTTVGGLRRRRLTGLGGHRRTGHRGGARMRARLALF